MQVFTLQILYQPDQRAAVRRCADQQRVGLTPAQQPHRAQAAFARHQLVAARAAAAHQQRRKQAVAAYGTGELAYGILVETGARLVWTGNDSIQVNAKHAPLGAGGTGNYCRHGRASCQLATFRRLYIQKTAKYPHAGTKNCRQ